jgi:hypothetical protein
MGACEYTPQPQLPTCIRTSKLTYTFTAIDHASPLPLLFGATNIAAAHPYSNASTQFELKVGSHMQDLWRAFVVDPYQLQAVGDWPLNQGGGVNQTTDAVKLIPGEQDGELSSVEYGARREEYCAEIDPYLVTQSLPPQFEEAIEDGNGDAL